MSPGSVKLLSSLTPDLRPLRESRDFRLLMLGQLVTGMGSQAALVALPFQVYELTGSAFLTGLVGLVELVPVVVASLLAGAIADRFDRRRLLELCQIALVQQRLAARLAAAADVRILPCPFPVTPLVEALWWHPVYERDTGHQWLRTVFGRVRDRLRRETV